ncbi:hypothetical protein H2198_003449 [Neophaeococcomyces mojaviensis]|uniref:Uncharacterized protein n=1 Tax=Neophaeococcomyces mojaviensis TaxID=3383035 RepID=A0ACC3ABB8_9EURO|nr:hypothetical protein H2198_003449 [Knufia sp. JES_112]
MAQAYQHNTSHHYDGAALHDQAVSDPVHSEVEQSPGSRITAELLNKGDFQSRQSDVVPSPKVYKMPSPKPDIVMSNLFVLPNLPNLQKPPAIQKTFSHPALIAQNTAFPTSAIRGSLFSNNDFLRRSKYQRSEASCSPEMPDPRNSILCDSRAIPAAGHDTRSTSDGPSQRSPSPTVEVENPHSRARPSENKAQCSTPQVLDRDRLVEKEATEKVMNSMDQQHMLPEVYVVGSSPTPPDQAQSDTRAIEEMASPAISHYFQETNGCYGNKDGMTQQQKRSDTVLSPYKTGSRIQKPLQRQAQHSLGSASPNITSSGHPSEEDLVMLLVQQNRTRHRAHVELQKRHQTLRQHSSRLLEENGRFRQQLTDTTNKWHATVQDHHVLRADLQAFKHKYSKLKKWALEMHEEYEGLRDCGDKVNDEISAIKSEIVGDAKNRNDLLAKCQSITSVFETIKKSVNESRASTLELNTTRQQLGAVQARLQEEKLQNKSYTTYIQRLEKSQQDLNNRLYQKQEQMHQDLASISNVVGEYKDGSLDVYLARVLEILESVQKQGVLKLTDLEIIKTTCATNIQTFTAVEEKLANTSDQQLDHHKAQMSILTALKDIMDGLRSKLDQVEVLQDSNQTLSERVHQAEVVSKLANREKTVAQLFASGLLEAHKQIINNRPSTQPNEQMNKIEHLRSMNNELHINLQQKSSEITTLRAEMNNLERKAEDLSSELAEKQAQNRSLQAELDSVQQSQHAELAQSKADLEVQIAMHTQKVADQSRELERCQQECQGLKARVAELVKSNKDIDGQLQEKVTQLTNRNNDFEKLQADIGLIREQYNAIKGTEATLRTLQLESVNLREASERVRQLEKDNADLQQTTVGDRSEIEHLQRDLADAQVKIHELQPLFYEVKSLQHIRSALEATVRQLETDMKTAQQNALSAQDLRTQLENEQARSENLQKLLAVAKDSTLKAASLKQELEACQRKNAQLEQIVQVGSQDKEELTNAQVSLQEQARQIQKLESRVSSLSVAESQLRTLAEESQRKDTELATMQDHITKLQTENRYCSLLPNSTTNDEISGLSQEIVLSLKSAESNEGQASGKVVLDEEDIAGRPKRAANRGFCEPSEPIVVPNSQKQTLNEGLDPESSSQISSPPPTPEDLASMFGDSSVVPATNTTDMSAVENQSAARRSTDVVTSGPEVRPTASNDDMLLRSSDPVDLAHASNNQTTGVLVPMSTQNGSPRKTRSGARVRHSTPLPQPALGSDQIENFSTPISHSREQHRPNSAVKRTATHDSNEQSSKMKKPNLKNMEVRERAKTPVSAVSQSPSDVSWSVYDLPSTSRRGSSIVGTRASAPGKSVKTAASKSTRQNRKNAQMGARFGDNTPSYPQA